MKRITRTFLTVAATAALALLSASAVLAGPAQPEGEFIPGVTDFPAPPAIFVPGVTDFPARPAIDPVTVSVPRADGFDWSDAGIGAGSVAVLALLATAALGALRRRSRAILGTAVLGVAMTAAAAGGALTLNHNETVLRG